MYRYHRERHDPLYSDAMIYSPDVPVIRGDDGLLLDRPYMVSIVTAPAANAARIPPERQQEIPATMWRRILKVLALGAAHRHDGIVLGAWGCGAFGGDGRQMASLFRRALEQNFRGVYRQVAFAIVDWSAERRFIGPFEDAFADWR
jgi:uncharacterized protein (TIGR02452 family)